MTATPPDGSTAAGASSPGASGTPDAPRTAASDTEIVALSFDLLEQRIPFCLATVVQAGRDTGLVPGQKLLVYEDGRTVGALGGATLTAAIAEQAVEQLRDEDVELVQFDLQGRQLPERRSMRGEAIEPGAVEVSLEPMLAPLRLVIVGAGHIAVPLCKFASICGFEVTVIDDRAQFASRERFPDATELVVDDFEQAISRQDITAWTYLVLVTRGHEHDEATLREVVTSPAPYIGMIGSRRRVLLVFERLLTMGVPDHFLDRIYAPIGLDIGARTPEEIALAIMAEIVNVRRGGRAPSLAEYVRQRRRRAAGALAV